MCLNFFPIYEFSKLVDYSLVSSKGDPVLLASSPPSFRPYLLEPMALNIWCVLVYYSPHFY